MIRLVTILFISLHFSATLVGQNCPYSQEEEKQVINNAEIILQEHINAMEFYLDEFNEAQLYQEEVLSNFRSLYADNVIFEKKIIGNPKSLDLEAYFKQLLKYYPLNTTFTVELSDINWGSVIDKGNGLFSIQGAFIIRTENTTEKQICEISFPPSFSKKVDNYKIALLKSNREDKLPLACNKLSSNSNTVFQQAERLLKQYESVLNQAVNAQWSERTIQAEISKNFQTSTIPIRENIYPGQNINSQNISNIDVYIKSLISVYSPNGNSKSIRFSNYTYSDIETCIDENRKEYPCILIKYKSKFSGLEKQSKSSYPLRHRVLFIELLNVTANKTKLRLRKIDFFEAIENSELGQSIQYSKNDFSLPEETKKNTEKKSKEELAENLIINYRDLLDKTISNGTLDESKVDAIFSEDAVIDNDLGKYSFDKNRDYSFVRAKQYFKRIQLYLTKFSTNKQVTVDNISLLKNGYKIDQILHHDYKFNQNLNSKYETSENQFIYHIQSTDKIAVIRWNSFNNQPQIFAIRAFLNNGDDDDDGIENILDLCPYTKGSRYANGCPDADDDGVADNIDQCPNLKGTKNSGGCPDEDFDGIADSQDDCPSDYGLRKNNGCPDFDSDGIIDKEDLCPWDAGDLALDGCPDYDKDGVPDKDDLCSYTYGLAKFNGCPDSDGDDVPDSRDDCPWTKGTLNGCPDSDGDNVADKNDNCPNLAGLEYLQGCPDSDGDRIADIDDECPTEYGPSEYRGCPDSDGDGFANLYDDCPCTVGVVGRSGCPTFDKRIHLGVTYQMFRGRDNFHFSTLPEQIQSDFNRQSFQNLGVSIYAPVGVFFSNFRQTNYKVPQVSYSYEEAKRTENILVGQSTPIVPLDYSSTKSNLVAFDAGFYIAPFSKSKYFNKLHFKLGLSFIEGYVWDEYSGALDGELEYIPGSLNYAVDKEKISTNNFIAGVALVFPFLQFEAEYNHLYKDIVLRSGVNIPFSVFYHGSLANSARARTIKRNRHYFFNHMRIGVNYNLMSPYFNSNNNNLGIWWNEVQNDFQNFNLGKFGISVYAPVGGFISNFIQINDGKPDYYYTEAEVNLAENILNQSSTPHQILSFSEKKYNLTSYDFGFYIAPITANYHTRRLHFIVGASILQGRVWDEYNGDISPQLQFSDPVSQTYALNYQSINNDGLILGAAYVFPFFQLEAGYNSLYKAPFIKLGTNIPFGFKKKNDFQPMKHKCI